MFTECIALVFPAIRGWLYVELKERCTEYEVHF